MKDIILVKEKIIFKNIFCGNLFFKSRKQEYHALHRKVNIMGNEGTII